MKQVLLTAAICAIAFPLLAPSYLFAQGTVKQTAARTIPVKKVFPFYDMYLSLPADTRDGFKIDYRLNLPTGAPRPQMTYVLGTTRLAVEVGASGQILNLPSREMLANGRIDIAANQPRSGIEMDLEPIIPLSRSISVSAATNSLTDYATAVRRAGPLAALAPKLKGIMFKGTTGGEAVFGDGRRIALAATPSGTVFQPNAPNMRGAVSLSFTAPPTRVEFSQ